MQGYDASTYGQGFADVYDEWYESRLHSEQALRALAEWAGDGPVLELGAGTGRLAIPLAAGGLRVVALDASEAMLEQLRAKPGGEDVETIVGDMSRPLPGGPYTLVFVAFNTLFNLDSRPGQQRVFEQVREVMSPGGRFVVEAFVPDPDAPAGSSVELRHLTADRVVLSVHRHDPKRQRAEGSYVEFSDDGAVRLRPWSVRYTSPDELDEMAHSAGLTREIRHAGWDGSPFTSESDHHVSIYRR